MNNQTYEMTIDTKKSHCHSNIEFSQNNLNISELIFNITEDEKPFPLKDTDKIIVYFRKPDKTVVFQDKEVILLDKTKGKIKVLLTSQTLAKSGDVQGEISIERVENGTKKRVSTYGFTFKVRSSIASNDSIESTNEFQVFDKIIKVGEKFEGVDIDGIIAAGELAKGAVKKSGDTMTGNLTVPRLYAGPSPDKQANVGTGSTDVYLANTLSKKYLQLKDDGALLYSNVPVALGDIAQMQKITLDNGGATISISDTSKNILDEIKTRGPGMNTIYCAGGVQGQTPNNKSWRGVSFLNSANYGLLWAKDFQSKFFTNYFDNGNWLGWIEHSDASLTQNIKVTQDNGDSIIQAKAATDDILQMVLDKGRGFHTIYAAGSAKNVPSSAGLRGFANLHGVKYGYIIATDFRNKLWTNYINGGEWQGWVNVNGNDKDGKANIPLTANGENFDTGVPLVATRRGNTVTVRGAIRAKSGTSGTIIVATLPVDMRPIDNQVLLAIDQGNQNQRVFIGSNGNIALYAAERNIYLQITYVVD